MFGLPHIRLVWLLFSAGTVFFSHNNSAGTMFFSQFQPKFCQPNGAKTYYLQGSYILCCKEGSDLAHGDTLILLQIVNALIILEKWKKLLVYVCSFVPSHHILINVIVNWWSLVFIDFLTKFLCFPLLIIWSQVSAVQTSVIY